MAKENAETKVQNPEEEVQGSSLQDFNWDEDTFFGIKDEDAEDIEKFTPPSTKVKTDEDSDDPNIGDDEEEDETPKPKSKSKTPDKSEEDEEEDDFFPAKQPEAEGEEDKDEGGSTVEGDAKFYSTLTSELKERGIFQNVELEEGEEIDEDKFFELHESEVEARVEETFQSFAEEMDDEGKDFIKFKRNGGKTSDFLQVYGNTLSIEGLDLEKEEDQDLIIKQYSSLIEGMDNEEISDRIEWLKESNKKKSFAEKYMIKLKSIDEKRKADLMARSETLAQNRKKDLEKFHQSLNTELQKTEKVGNFDFQKVDKKNLIDYITKPSVKVGKNKYISKFQAEIGEIFKAEGEQKKKLLLLAKLVMSDFDVKDIIEQTKTETVKKAKSKLQSARTNVKASSSGNSTRKSLYDYF